MWLKNQTTTKNFFSEHAIITKKAALTILGEITKDSKSVIKFQFIWYMFKNATLYLGDNTLLYVNSNGPLRTAL